MLAIWEVRGKIALPVESKADTYTLSWEEGGSGMVRNKIRFCLREILGSKFCLKVKYQDIYLLLIYLTSFFFFREVSRWKDVKTEIFFSL